MVNIGALPKANPPSDSERDPVSVQLLGGFSLLQGGAAVELPPSVQRIVAFLALRGPSPASRSMLCCRLWPDVDERECSARLRSGLWRLRQRCTDVVDGQGDTVTLKRAVHVDVRDADAHARRILEPSLPLDGLPDDLGLLSSDLLPEWWDEWVITERERWRQLRLHALEALASRLADEGRYEQAICAALTAVAAEPLRESPHRVLVAIHLAEGNRSEALRCYEDYRALLGTELGIEPSPKLDALVDSVRAPASTRTT